MQDQRCGKELKSNLSTNFEKNTAADENMKQKSILSYSCLFLALLFTQVSQAHAAWSYLEKTDSITDEINRTAIVKNSNGDEFAIYMVEDKVWALFKISNNSMDILSTTNLPVIRIDKQKPIDLKQIKSFEDLYKNDTYKRKFVIESPKFINFSFWGGSIDRICGNLADLIHGEKLIVRYWLFTGGYKEVIFDITGGSDAILKAVGGNNANVCNN